MAAARSQIEYLSKMLILQAAIPNILWILFTVFGNGITYPISDPMVAKSIFRKLGAETKALGEIYSSEIADRYALNFSNSFFIGLAVFCVVFLLALYNLHRERKIRERSSVVKRSIGTKPSSPQAKMSACCIVVLYLTFFVPTTFYPGPGLDTDRVLNSQYGFFTIMFPCLFIFTLLIAMSVIVRRK